MDLFKRDTTSGYKFFFESGFSFDFQNKAKKDFELTY